MRPGDVDDWLIDEEEDFDPLEGMEPDPPVPPAPPPQQKASQVAAALRAPVPVVPAPVGTPAEVASAWNAVQFQPGEKGRGEGFTFQRFRDPKNQFAKVVFVFVEQPPSQGAIGSAAGTGWYLDTTQVIRKTITAYYVRRA